MESNLEFLDLLLTANNKETLREIIRRAYCFEGPGQTEGDDLIKITSECLSLQDSTQIIQLLRGIQQFEKSIVHQGLDSPSSIEALLPGDFQSKLKKFLVACIQENVCTWMVLREQQEIFAPKLVDFDWTINLATASSSQSHLNVPICSLQLQIMESEMKADSRILDMELNPGSLDMLIDRLNLIKNQLTSISSGSSGGSAAKS